MVKVLRCRERKRKDIWVSSENSAELKSLVSLSTHSCGFKITILCGFIEETNRNLAKIRSDSNSNDPDELTQLEINPNTTYTLSALAWLTTSWPDL
ncbi:hypothetical protein L3X38_036875 [Prunus dulcis]|uniref:Uncharacterized protein n=1 Tax=Prunus dulcis TaxID=3755 RepID=A0AAD4YQR9_PRUDU|nr:hypothetical protein L3X38_036875 [Prunus dulcis]